jgi:hypothetical protein
VAELDLTATFPNPPFVLPTRVMTGRPAGLAQSGQMPTHTCILPSNDTGLVARPGLLITENIDISASTGPGGATEFLVYWKLVSFESQQDVQDENTGVNIPAVCRVFEGDQEPSGFFVLISPDDGTNWYQVDLLVPETFMAGTTTFRLAFMNLSSVRVYLASFAVLF